MLVLCLCLLTARNNTASAQEPATSIPMRVSLQGGVHDLGFSYSFSIDKNDNFQSVSLFLDMQGLSTGKVNYPGGFARYDYHFALLNTRRMLLYAGPGAILGYMTDTDQIYGITLGLCGNIGLKYQFDKHLDIGLSLHPVLGYHLNLNDGGEKLNIYQAGLWRSILPEISVGYSIGKQVVNTAHEEHFRAAGKPRSRPWTLGLEFAYKPSIYNYLLSMYLADDGSRYYYKEDQAAFHNNASIMLSAAWHFTDFYQLRMLMGYAGIKADVRVHELLLRNQWNFKSHNTQGDRFFTALDTGIALKAGDLQRPYAVLNLSFGYSLAVSANSNIEFFIRSGNTYGTPTLYEDGKIVPADRAYKTRMFVSSIDLGIALDL